MKIYKNVIAGIFAVGLSPNVLAQQNDQYDDNFEVNGLVRINTRLNSETCRQILPNLVINAKKGNFKVSGALKVDNLEPAEGCFDAEHDERLFFLNATYIGLQEDFGTVVKAGLFTPFELSKFPLSKGFTLATVDNDDTLFGGIIGMKIDQNLPLSDDRTNVTLNGGLGYKPDGNLLERFGPSVDLITFAGVNLTHRINMNSTLQAGYEYIHLSDDKNPEGKNHFSYAQFDLKGKKVDTRLYVEHLTREQCMGSLCNETVHRSIAVSTDIHVTPSTDWQIAAGVSDGAQRIETSLYHDFGKKGGMRGVIGAGHDFETDDNSVRTGLLYSF